MRRRKNTSSLSQQLYLNNNYYNYKKKSLWKTYKTIFVDKCVKKMKHTKINSI